MQYYTMYLIIVHFYSHPSFLPCRFYSLEVSYMYPDSDYGIPGNEGVSDSSTLFVGDLSVSCLENDLYELFSAYGIVTNIRVMKTRKNASLGYAFVTLSSFAEAHSAMNQLNGIMFCGRKLRIGLADARRADSNFKYVFGKSPTSHPYSPTNPDSPTNSNHLKHPSNSVYFKFSISKQAAMFGKSTDEGIIRDLINNACGSEAVSDLSIRRITDEAVSLVYIFFTFFFFFLTIKIQCLL